MPGRPADEWRVELLLQDPDDPSLLVPAAEVWRRRERLAPLERAGLRPQERLLAIFQPRGAGKQDGGVCCCRRGIGGARARYAGPSDLTGSEAGDRRGATRFRVRRSRSDFDPR